MSSQSVNGKSHQTLETRSVAASNVQSVSPKSTFASFEIIDAVELARRLTVPVSWVRSRTRLRTLDEIPTIRFGRYCRFAWGSPELSQWIAAHEGRR